MELTKSLKETLDGMNLTVKYSTNNKNEIMCIWESGNAQSDEAITFILNKKIDFNNIIVKTGIHENTLVKGLKIYLDGSNSINKVNGILNEEYTELKEFCEKFRGKILTTEFGI